MMLFIYISSSIFKLLYIVSEVGACSSAWLERIPDKDEAGGSSPPRPTNLI